MKRWLISFRCDGFEERRIENNSFYDDTILLPKDGNIRIENNRFSLKGKNEAPVAWRFEKVNSHKILALNTVEVASLVSTSIEISTDGTSLNVDEIAWIDNQRTFRITNTGEFPVSLFGFPQVLLTENPLAPGDRGPGKSGVSMSNGLTILAADQPNKLVLRQNESTQFRIIDSGHGSGEAIANIPYGTHKGSDVLHLKIKRAILPVSEN